MDNIFLIAKVGSMHLSIIPHWLKHYIKHVGIRTSNIIVTVHIDRPERLATTLDLFSAYGITPFAVVEGAFTPMQMMYLCQKMVMSLPSTSWVIAPDADEFNFVSTPILQLIGECEEGGYDYVSSLVVDRVADRGIPELCGNVSIWEQLPKESRITEVVGLGMAVKLALFRPFVIPECHGYHRPSQRYARSYKRHPALQKTYHFKWHGDVYAHMQASRKPVSKRLCRYIDRHESLVVLKRPALYGARIAWRGVCRLVSRATSKYRDARYANAFWQ